MAADASSSKRPQLTAYHYILVMSEDDGLCRPLTNLYNRLLKSKILDLMPPTPGEELPPSFTDFELEEPNAFTELGLTVPPEVPSNGSGLYFADVFNDGSPRYVKLVNRYEKEGKVTVLKKGAEYHEITEIKSYNKLLRFTKIDPDLIDPTGSLPVESFNSKIIHVGGYKLTKWPKYDKYVEASLKFTNSLEFFEHFPALFFGLGSYSSVGVFLYKSTYIFLRNDYIDMREAFLVGEKSIRITNSIILIYKITSSGPNDLCYIALAPTPLTETLKEKFR